MEKLSTNPFITPTDWSFLLKEVIAAKHYVSATFYETDNKNERLALSEIMQISKSKLTELQQQLQSGALKFTNFYQEARQIYDCTENLLQNRQNKIDSNWWLWLIGKIANIFLQQFQFQKDSASLQFDLQVFNELYQASIADEIKKQLAIIPQKISELQTFSLTQEVKNHYEAYNFGVRVNNAYIATERALDNGVDCVVSDLNNDTKISFLHLEPKAEASAASLKVVEDLLQQIISKEQSSLQLWYKILQLSIAQGAHQEIAYDQLVLQIPTWKWMDPFGKNEYCFAAKSKELGHNVTIHRTKAGFIDYVEVCKTNKVIIAKWSKLNDSDDDFTVLKSFGVQVQVLLKYTIKLDYPDWPLIKNVEASYSVL